MSDSLQVVCPACNAVNRVPATKLAAGGQCGKCKQPLFQAHPTVLTEANFATQVGRSDIPVVVDFWAPWCGPCRMMAPVYEQAAGELEPRVRLAKLDTEAEQAVAARYQIRSIPTLMLFRNGREVARQAGALNRAQLLSWVKAHC